MADHPASPPLDRQTSPSPKTIPSAPSNSRLPHLDPVALSRQPPSPRIGANRSSSLAETFRSAPLSPRAHRTSSVSAPAIQELLNNPPSAQEADPAFEGRDWRSIRVEEIIDHKKVRFVHLDE